MARLSGGVRVLVVNAGSTSLKLHVVEPDDAARRVATLADGLAAGPGAVAHRIVHGGPDVRAPALVDDRVVALLEAAAPLAPLHSGPALRALADARAALPGLPHVVVPDTGFHATLPAAATTYAVPRDWRERHGIRRYGFHGLSVAWSVERAAALLGRPASALGLVVCHLGGGMSVTAVRDGASADTTMGLTPLEGLPMATRAGTLDAGALLLLLRAGAVDLDGLEDALERRSGLLGLSGRPGGLAAVEAARAAGDPDAQLAFDVLVHRLAGAIGAAAVAAGRLDALVFTGGAGEGSSALRAATAARLGLLGVALDADANATATPDADVAASGAGVRVLVIGAREELVAARAARLLVG